jgi:hypothetical protein
MTRVGRAYAEGMRLAAQVENEAYVARFEEPVLRPGSASAGPWSRPRRSPASSSPWSTGP